MLTKLEASRLRNRIPQNIVDEISAREVAKDIMQNDIVYREMPELVKDCVKYLLIGGLIELFENEKYEQRTLGNLFEWMRQKDRSSSHDMSKQYFDMLSMVPEQDQSLARFYICDSLIKYQVFNKETEIAS